MFLVSSRRTGVLHATVTMNACPLRVEIDTSVAVSIASLKPLSLSKRRRHGPELGESTFRL